MQTTTEQLCAKPTDLVVKGQESAPHYRLWKWESNCKVNSAGELVLLKCTGRVWLWTHTELMRAVLEGISANSDACQNQLTSWELTPGGSTFCSCSNFLLSDLLTDSACWKRLFCKLLHYLFFTCDVMLFLNCCNEIWIQLHFITSLCSYYLPRQFLLRTALQMLTARRRMESQIMAEFFAGSF